MIYYGVYNRKGERMYQFPLFRDVKTAYRSLEYYRSRHPEWGLYVDEVEV